MQCFLTMKNRRDSFLISLVNYTNVSIIVHSKYMSDNLTTQEKDDIIEKILSFEDYELAQKMIKNYTLNDSQKDRLYSLLVIKQLM